jgi:hypothetical protein
LDPAVPGLGPGAPALPRFVAFPAEPPVLARPAPPRRNLLDALLGAYRQLAPAGLAVALIVLALVGMWGVQLNDQVTMQARMLAMLRAPGSQTVALEPMTTTTSATGQVLMAPGHAEMALLVAHLMPQPGRVYQAWLLMEDGRLMPCGTVTVDNMGVAVMMLHLPVAVEKSRGFVITDEPSGQVLQPSGTKWLEAQYR